MRLKDMRLKATSVKIPLYLLRELNRTRKETNQTQSAIIIEALREKLSPWREWKQARAISKDKEK